MKRFIHSIVVLSGSVTILMLGLSFLLFKPLDRHAWRIEFHVPILGEVSVNAYPLLQIAVSLPGRKLLNGTRWQSSHGVLWLQNESGVLWVNCEPCTFLIPELSKYPVRIDRLSLSVRLINRQLSGLLSLQSGAYASRVFYTGQIDTDGVNLNWSLPKTPVYALLQPLKGHSLTMQKAGIKGTLAATGNLQWPGRKLSVRPELQGFEVTGLGTEMLKVAQLNYHCQSAPANRSIAPYAWITEKNMGRWLPKAVLIAEDASFTRHPGYSLDIISVLLARHHHAKQPGGSTITQQLAKYLFTGGERTGLRKLEELLYAVEMEQTLGKRLILALYLNTVDWGPGICGAGQAASVYFGKRPAQLSPIQAAWLAGIIRNPHRAWRQEYLSQKPDLERLSRVVKFMPGKISLSQMALKFAEPSSKSLTQLMR